MNKPQHWLRNKSVAVRAKLSKAVARGKASIFGKRQLHRKICHLVKLSFPHPDGVLGIAPTGLCLNTFTTVRQT